MAVFERVLRVKSGAGIGRSTSTGPANDSTKESCVSASQVAFDATICFCLVYHCLAEPDVRQ